MVHLSSSSLSLFMEGSLRIFIYAQKKVGEMEREKMICNRNILCVTRCCTRLSKMMYLYIVERGMKKTKYTQSKLYITRYDKLHSIIYHYLFLSSCLDLGCCALKSNLRSCITVPVKLCTEKTAYYSTLLFSILFFF